MLPSEDHNFSKKRESHISKSPSSSFILQKIHSFLRLPLQKKILFPNLPYFSNLLTPSSAISLQKVHFLQMITTSEKIILLDFPIFLFFPNFLISQTIPLRPSVYKRCIPTGKKVNKRPLSKIPIPPILTSSPSLSLP